MSGTAQNRIGRARPAAEADVWVSSRVLPHRSQENLGRSRVLTRDVLLEPQLRCVVRRRPRLSADTAAERQLVTAWLGRRRSALHRLGLGLSTLATGLGVLGQVTGSLRSAGSFATAAGLAGRSRQDWVPFRECGRRKVTWSRWRRSVRASIWQSRERAPRSPLCGMVARSAPRWPLAPRIGIRSHCCQRLGPNEIHRARQTHDHVRVEPQPRAAVAVTALARPAGSMRPAPATRVRAQRKPRRERELCAFIGCSPF